MLHRVMSARTVIPRPNSPPTGNSRISLDLVGKSLGSYVCSWPCSQLLNSTLAMIHIRYLLPLSRLLSRLLRLRTSELLRGGILLRALGVTDGADTGNSVFTEVGAVAVLRGLVGDALVDLAGGRIGAVVDGDNVLGGLVRVTGFLGHGDDAAVFGGLDADGLLIVRLPDWRQLDVYDVPSCWQTRHSTPLACVLYLRQTAATHLVGIRVDQVHGVPGELAPTAGAALDQKGILVACARSGSGSGSGPMDGEHTGDVPDEVVGNGGWFGHGDGNELEGSTVVGSWRVYKLELCAKNHR